MLNRIRKLNICTYGYRYDIDYKNEDKEKIENKINKSRRMRMGLILEDLYEIFPNCTEDLRFNELDDNLITDPNCNVKGKKVCDKIKNKKLENMKDDEIKNCGITYNNVLLYFILGFQEFMNNYDK